MQIQIKVFLMHAIDRIEEFKINVNEENCLIVKEKIKFEHARAVFFLKDLKGKGAIRSIWIPKNKHIQKDLDKIVYAKREMKESLSKLKSAFE